MLRLPVHTKQVMCTSSSAFYVMPMQSQLARVAEGVCARVEAAAAEALATVQPHELSDRIGVSAVAKGLPKISLQPWVQRLDVAARAELGVWEAAGHLGWGEREPHGA